MARGKEARRPGGARGNPGLAAGEAGSWTGRGRSPGNPGQSGYRYWHVVCMVEGTNRNLWQGRVINNFRLRSNGSGTPRRKHQGIAIKIKGQRP